jgi:hypothetical protein
LAAKRQVVAVAFGDDAVVVGELALDQLGHELHAVKAELGLVVGELHLDRAVGVRQQALQLEHGFARQDDFLFGGHFDVERGSSEGQAVAVGRDQAQAVTFGHKQDAVEVVTDVVHGHGKRDLPQQLLEGFLRHAEHGAEAGGFLHQREVFSGQGLQSELGLAALQDQLGLRRLKADGLVSGHGAQDVDEFACAHGGGEVAWVTVHLGRGADLDFQVAGGQLNGVAQDT